MELSKINTDTLSSLSDADLQAYRESARLALHTIDTVIARRNLENDNARKAAEKYSMLKEQQNSINAKCKSLESVSELRQLISLAKLYHHAKKKGEGALRVELIIDGILKPYGLDDDRRVFAHLLNIAKAR